MSDLPADASNTFPARARRWSTAHVPGGQRTVWIVLGLLLLFLLIWAIRPSATSQKNGHGFGAGGPVPVGVATVSSGDVKVTVDGLGAVTPLATVTVHPEVTGYLNKFDFTEGQMVQAGQVLAEIDPRPFQAALDQAKGQMARDQATLANAKIDLGRYQALWKANAISQQTLQTQMALVGTDEGTIVADKAAVEAARINLEFCRITSPVTGRVGLRQVDPGNLVTAGTATALVVVTQLQPISVIFSLPEDTINQVMRHYTAGQKLPVAAYDRSMTTKLADGVLSNVDNEIDPTTGMVKMRAMFDNADNALFPSQFVNIRLLLDTLHNQTYVPAAAIQHGAQGTYVYVIDKDLTANMQTVKTGPTDGDKIAITDGLSPGERVVVDGADRLKDGGQVALPGTKSAAGSAADGASSPSAQPDAAGQRHKWNGKHRHGHHHHPSGDQSGGGQGGSP